MTHCNCQRCKEQISILGLTPPVTFEEITTAHRDLAKVWHPDRFENDPHLRNKAEEQFKSIQAAFTQLKEHRFASPLDPIAAPRRTPENHARPNHYRSLPLLSEYYRQEFRSILESGETYKGKWNWAAFCFGWIWALTKGLWVPALVCVVVSAPLGGYPLILFVIYFGARGNYLYYKRIVKNEGATFIKRQIVPCAQTRGSTWSGLSDLGVLVASHATLPAVCNGCFGWDWMRVRFVSRPVATSKGVSQRALRSGDARQERIGQIPVACIALRVWPCITDFLNVGDAIEVEGTDNEEKINTAAAIMAPREL
jgi:hypothetical protein